MLRALQELKSAYENKPVICSATNQYIPSLRFRGDFNQFLNALLTRIDTTTGKAKADEPFDTMNIEKHCRDIEKHYREYLFGTMPATSSGYYNFKQIYRFCSLTDLYTEAQFW